jgi:hypothetical protein
MYLLQQTESHFSFLAYLFLNQSVTCPGPRTGVIARIQVWRERYSVYTVTCLAKWLGERSEGVRPFRSRREVDCPFLLASSYLLRRRSRSKDNSRSLRDDNKKNKAKATANYNYKATTKTKCGGLSAARWTMRPSIASVEMTQFLGFGENEQRQQQIPSGDDNKKGKSNGKDKSEVLPLRQAQGQNDKENAPSEMTGE